MDLSSLDIAKVSDEGAKCVLVHPVTQQILRDADGNEVSITLAGTDSEAYRKAQRKLINKRLAAKGKGTITAEQVDADDLQILGDCTLSWEGLLVDGVQLVCSASAAIKLYSDPRFPWIREQATAFMNDRANYLSD